MSSPTCIEDNFVSAWIDGSSTRDSDSLLDAFFSCCRLAVDPPSSLDPSAHSHALDSIISGLVRSSPVRLAALLEAGNTRSSLDMDILRSLHKRCLSKLAGESADIAETEPLKSVAKQLLLSQEPGEVFSVLGSLMRRDGGCEEGGAALKAIVRVAVDSMEGADSVARGT